MGLARRLRKKYETPSHPWQRARIEHDKALAAEYGLKRKNEIWKMNSLLSKIRGQAKILLYDDSEQGEKEKKQLVDRLVRLGLLNEKSDLDTILGLNLNDIMDLRLQTIVYKAGLAKTANQARQLIVHGHISVDGKKITVPSYLVMQNERGKVIYNPKSAFNKEDHPERPKVEMRPVKVSKEEKKAEKENKAEKKEEKKKTVKKKEAFLKESFRKAFTEKNSSVKINKEKPVKEAFLEKASATKIKETKKEDGK